VGFCARCASDDPAIIADSIRRSGRSEETRETQRERKRKSSFCIMLVLDESLSRSVLRKAIRTIKLARKSGRCAVLGRFLSALLN